VGAASAAEPRSPGGGDGGGQRVGAATGQQHHLPAGVEEGERGGAADAAAGAR
jgi:hypothetical protein